MQKPAFFPWFIELEYSRQTTDPVIYNNSLQTQRTIMPLRGYSLKLTEHKPLDTKPSVICFPEHIFKLFLFFALLFSHCYYPVCKNWSFCNGTSYPAALLTFWTCWLSSTKLDEGIEFLKLHKNRWIGREEQPYASCHWRCAVTSCLGTHQWLHMRQYPYECPGCITVEVPVSLSKRLWYGTR